MDILDEEESDVELLELQGEVENMEAFDGRFDKELIQLEFGTFILSGRRVEKEFCILEQNIKDDKRYLRIIKKVKNVYLFDKPPKYKRPLDAHKTQK